MATDEDPQHAAEGLPEPGDMIAGKYRVERVVGVGGMGVVVAAMHLQLEERVAIKLLKREVTRPDTIARFLREARSAVKIKSEHVARVIDVGTFDSGRDGEPSRGSANPSGVPYMVMELLEGEDLGALVQRRGPLDPSLAADYVLQACEAVAEAHAIGIVHRDLKPANLFLAKRPGGQRVVKVVDFGISKQMGENSEPGPMDEAARTRTSAWLGSPLYMSPEQMRSARDVDSRTDLWALGLILYELTTAHLPFDAPSMVELCGRVLHDQATPLETWLPTAPPTLLKVVARCLRKNRDERYSTVAEIAVDLAPLAPPSGKPRIDRIVSILEGIGLVSTDPGPDEWTDRPVLLLRPSMPSLPEAPQAMEPRPSGSGPKMEPRPSGSGPKMEPRPSGSGPEPRPSGSGPAKPPDHVTARTSAGTSTPDPPRRRGGLWLFLALTLLGGAASTGFLRFRARAWPFASLRPPAPSDVAPDSIRSAASVPPPVSASAPIVPVVMSALAPPPVVSVVDAGTDGGRIADAGTDAGRPDAGVRHKTGWAQGAGAGEAHDTSASSPPPVPASALKPEVFSEKCFQELPDGTRKVVPCP